MIKTAAKAVNRLLRPLGIQVNRAYPVANQPDMVPAVLYKIAVGELHDALTDMVFKDLPYVERRKELLLQLMGTNISEAMWILDCLYKALSVEGDVCEFGVAHGATSTLMANEIFRTDKTLWLFDSFEGLPRPTEKDVLIDDIMGLGSMDAYQGVFSYQQSVVLGKLDGIRFPRSRIRIVPGFIEDTIKTAELPSRVCFAYVDFDFYEPISVALAFLADVVSVGGYIIVDDYGFFSAGAQAAVDEFCAAHTDSFSMTLPPRWAGHFAVLRKDA